jgi:uncharacterized lipoprotein YddW (UPF0748 family)
MMKRLFLSVILCSLMVAAVYAAKNKPVIETRGVWLDKGDLYQGKDAMAKAFDELSAANFNTVCLPVMYRGYVVYPGSAYLPQDPQIAAIDKDYLKWLVKEAKARGFHVEAWPEYGYYAYYTKDASQDTSRGAILDKYPFLTAVNSQGGTYLHNTVWGDYYSLCPSNPQSHAIMKTIYMEIAVDYGFDALNLDRIRYPGTDFCFCDYCKEHFKADTGIALAPEFLKSEGGQKTFDRWRMDQLNKFMKELTDEIHQKLPEMMITADVWDTSENEGRGQDWGTWLKEDYIDAAMPMLYVKDVRDPLKKAIALSPDSKRILVGITVEGDNHQQVISQVKQARKLKCGGFVFWAYNQISDDLPYLKAKVFKKPAIPYKPERLQKSSKPDVVCVPGPDGMVCMPK